ncbi:MAG: Mov34/MPN/PAD-1 family protein [Infirmifilum sp.]
MELCRSLIGLGSNIHMVYIPALFLQPFRESLREKIAVIAGTVDGGAAYVREVMELTGRNEEGLFRTGFQDWFHAVKELEKRGHKYLGLLHNHPYASPTPSPLDVERMSECPGEIWIIVSSSDVKGWVFGSELIEVRLVIT